MDQRQYVVKKAFGTVCCDLTLQAGETIKLIEPASKNRLFILHNGIEVHKVKRSTFNRCCELKV